MARIEQFAVLRGLVATAIVISHYGRSTFWGNVVGPVETGSLRVAVFFVLSGFVLGFAYAERDSLQARAFYIRRISKLVPVIWPTLIPLLVVGSGIVLIDILFYLSFTQAWYPPKALIINPPVWSLSVQFFFYLAFPFTLICVLRYFRTRWLLPALILYWLAMIGVLHSMMASVAYAKGNGVVRGLVFSFPPTQFVNFLFGIFAGIAMKRQLPLALWVGQNSLPILAISLFSLTLGNFLPLQLAALIGSKTIYHGVCWTPVITLFLLALAYAPAAIANPLSSRPAIWFGRASFAIFAWHVPLFAIGAGLFGRNTITQPVGFTLYLIVVLALSFLSARYWERPASKWVERVLMFNGKRE